MTIIETIRAEIERLKGQLVRGACASQVQLETTCKEEAYNEVLAKLATLQEQPVCEGVEEMAEESAENYAYAKPDEVFSAYKDGFIEGYKAQKKQSELSCEGLEEEMIAWHKKHFNGKRKWEETSGEYLEHSSQLDLARHFAQWGAEHRGSSETPKDLEEAAGEYEKKHTYQRYDGGGLTPEYDATLAEAFIDGYILCKEQMMKEAVEHFVVGEIASSKGMPVIVHFCDDFKIGQKVKLIIIKED